MVALRPLAAALTLFPFVVLACAPSGHLPAADDATAGAGAQGARTSVRAQEPMPTIGPRDGAGGPGRDGSIPRSPDDGKTRPAAETRAGPRSHRCLLGER